MLRTLALLSLLLATACASGASAPNMAVQPANIGVKGNPALKNAMAVNNVSGGSETNPMWMSKVDSNSFKSALQLSLANMGYAAPEGKAAKYTVDAELTSLDQPFMGFTFDVVSTVKYTVSRGNSQKTYPITATGSASPSDAFYGPDRLRIANERSIQQNIKAFLAALSSEAP